MNGCIYRTKDGECDMWSEGGKYTAFCDPDCKDRHPSNADYFRSMNDEELAEALCLLSGGQGPFTSADKRHWLDWIRQEATRLPIKSAPKPEADKLTGVFIEGMKMPLGCIDSHSGSGCPYLLWCEPVKSGGAPAVNKRLDGCPLCYVESLSKLY